VLEVPLEPAFYPPAKRDVIALAQQLRFFTSLANFQQQFLPLLTVETIVVLLCRHIFSIYFASFMLLASISGSLSYVPERSS
jgi:hypothetical protein